MNVNLTPQLEDLVRQKVASGRYTSASEVVREALRLMQEQDELREVRREELRPEVRRGLDRGVAVPWDADRIKREGRARRSAKAPKPKRPRPRCRACCVVRRPRTMSWKSGTTSPRTALIRPTPGSIVSMQRRDGRPPSR
jgi:antitoxin ParD1/3/4